MVGRERHPANDRSLTIVPMFQSHCRDPKLYVPERSYGNKNTI